MAVRQLKFDGALVDDPAWAVITVNGIECYNGVVGEGKPLNETTEMCVLNYRGSTIDIESITIEVVATKGSFSIGTIWNDSPGKEPPWNWPNEDGINDGRSKILINGEPPKWPLTEDCQQPKGTKENPGWAGWCFELSEGDTFSCNYATTNWAAIQDLVAMRYSAPD